MNEGIVCMHDEKWSGGNGSSGRKEASRRRRKKGAVSIKIPILCRIYPLLFFFCQLFAIFLVPAVLRSSFSLLFLVVLLFSLNFLHFLFFISLFFYFFTSTLTQRYTQRVQTQNTKVRYSYTHNAEYKMQQYMN